MISATLKLLQLALLVGAFFVTTAFLRATPAFNEELRDQNAYDSERLPLSAPMYDPGEYLFRNAYTYVYGTVVVPVRGREVESVSAQAIITNAAIAEVKLNESLWAKPGNAHTWELLARARAIQFAPIEEVLQPLARSWALAPNNLQLAAQRIDLVGLVAEDIEEGAPYAPNPENILRDAKMLDRFIPDELEINLELSEYLQALLSDMERTRP